jgi:hypothetical protein
MDASRTNDSLIVLAAESPVVWGEERLNMVLMMIRGLLGGRREGGRELKARACGVGVMYLRFG